MSVSLHDITPQAQPVVFLSSPMSMYQTRRYQDALQLLQKHYSPGATVLITNLLWESTRAWRRTYREVLAPVTDHYLLTDLVGFIGRGCYAEWLFLRERGIRTILLGDHAAYPLLDIDVVLPNDWRQYATGFIVGEAIPEIPWPPQATATRRTQVRPKGAGYAAREVLHDTSA